MRRIRVIPVLLLHEGGLVKSKRFKDYQYVGDPINAVKIFNEKEIDEIVILDIDATREKRAPDFDRIKQIAGEAFIPLAYGGGIQSISHVQDLFYLGVEKVIFNTAAHLNPDLLSQAAKLVGSQSIVGSIDIKKNWLGKKKVVLRNATESLSVDPVQYARQLVNAGAGELFVNSVDLDGTYSGYDLDLIKEISNAVSVPVIACGGASSVDDFLLAVKSGASAVAAGSMFVFQRPHQAVLISYPQEADLVENLFNKIN